MDLKPCCDNGIFKLICSASVKLFQCISIAMFSLFYILQCYLQLKNRHHYAVELRVVNGSLIVLRLFILFYLCILIYSLAVLCWRTLPFNKCQVIEKF